MMIMLSYTYYLHELLTILDEKEQNPFVMD